MSQLLSYIQPRFKHTQNSQACCGDGSVDSVYHVGTKTRVWISWTHVKAGQAWWLLLIPALGKLTRVPYMN